MQTFRAWFIFVVHALHSTIEKPHSPDLQESPSDAWNHTSRWQASPLWDANLGTCQELAWTCQDTFRHFILDTLFLPRTIRAARPQSFLGKLQNNVQHRIIQANVPRETEETQLTRNRHLSTHSPECVSWTKNVCYFIEIIRAKSGAKSVCVTVTRSR
jgi:hypothetical protein